jgi:hypothetical protein
MDVPLLAPGPGKEMLKRAIQHLASMPPDADERADAFETMAQQIERDATTPWAAWRARGADGSHIFLGRITSNALVVAPDGRVYSGGIGSGLVIGKHGLEPDYTSLKPIL